MASFSNSPNKNRPTCNGSFTLFEDENTNYNYKKGRFSTIPFNDNEKNKELTIEKLQGEFSGILQKRTFEIVWINGQKPSGLDFQSEPDAIISYDGNQQSIRMKQK